MFLMIDSFSLEIYVVRTQSTQILKLLRKREMVADIFQTKLGAILSINIILNESLSILKLPTFSKFLFKLLIPYIFMDDYQIMMKDTSYHAYKTLSVQFPIFKHKYFQTSTRRLNRLINIIKRKSICTFCKETANVTF